MCRFLAYTGAPVYLDTLLVHPRASLIAQSLAAREAKTVVNADGCGIGWYGEREMPGLYRGILPAWSDANLTSLCHQIKTGRFFAHVRSATAGEVATANCHPFTVGRHLFMHNGQIGDYARLRRRVDMLIPEELYGHRRGTGDSEAIFLAALGQGLDQEPVAAIRRTVGLVVGLMRETDCKRAFRFAAVHTDGQTLWAYHWSSDDKPPSLYWRRTRDGVVVASEAFDEAFEDWTPIRKDGLLTVTADGAVSEGDFSPILPASANPLLGSIQRDSGHAVEGAAIAA
jgi:glutamine amidotransferase